VIDVKMPTGAVVMVGDGRSARFLRNKGSPQHVELVLERAAEAANDLTSRSKPEHAKLLC
jgi:protein required for attachment to host cells